MSRAAGWEDRLFSYVDASVKLPFVRGENCCALWILGAVDAVTGSDHLFAHAGRFSDLDGANAYLADNGWSDLGEALAAITGATPLKLASFARVGDLVHVPYRDGMEFAGGALFVSLGRDVVGREDGKPGIVRFPLRRLLALNPRAYRV